MQTPWIRTQDSETTSDLQSNTLPTGPPTPQSYRLGVLQEQSANPDARFFLF